MLTLRWLDSLRHSRRSTRLSRRRSARRSTSALTELLERRTLLSSVTSTLDTVDAGDGVTTLREAILDANATAGPDTIDFAIPGAGPHTIVLTGGALPSVTDELEINGAAQAITIDASAVTAAPALRFIGGSDNSTLHHLAIANASHIAINVQVTSGVTIENVDVSWGGATPTGTGIDIAAASSISLNATTALNRNRGVQGFAMTGSTINDVNASGAANIAIYVTGNSGNNTYSNNDVSGSLIGMQLLGSDGNETVEVNNASDTVFGISSRNGVGNAYRNNDLSNASVLALDIQHDNQFSITGNDFTDSNDGIRIRTADNFTITPNATDWDVDLSSVTDVALELQFVDNATIDGIDLSFGGASVTGRALLVSSGGGNTVRNITASTRNRGVELIDVTDSTVEDNMLAGSFTGILTSGNTGRNTYQRNDVSNSTIGMQLNGTLGQEKVESNNASNTFIGIGSSNGVGGVYRNNDVSNTDSFGLTISDDDQFVVTGNDFTDSNDGIRIRSADNFTITPDASTWDVDVSSVTDVALQLESVNGVTVDGVDLTYSGVSRSGTGLLLTSGTNNTVTGTTIGNRRASAHIWAARQSGGLAL